MSIELPFCNLSDEDLKSLLEATSCNNNIHVRLPNDGLRDYLFTLSTDPHFKSLDSDYYTSEQFNHKVRRVKNQIELSIFHLNIRSLNSKQMELCIFIDLLETDFDILILSEIWSHNVEFYHNIFDGYSFYYDLPKNSSVGGLGMYIKNQLTSKARPDLCLKSRSDLKVENLWFEVKKNKSKFIIGGLYRHPNHCINKFSEALELSLNKIAKNKTPCFIAGDINIDFLQVERNKNVEKYLNNLLVHNFLPTLLLPTRITTTSATVIDHIYYYQGHNSTKELRLSSGNLFSDLSDHLPNFVLLTSVANRVNLKDRPLIRLFTDSNKQKFRDCLSGIDWQNTLFNNELVNDCYNTFISVITKLYDNCFPLTRQSRRACKDKKWVTKELKVSSRQKEKLYRRWIFTKHDDDDKVNYCQYKKTFSKVLEGAKMEYYGAQFDCKTNSIKQIWNNLNRVCSAKKDKKYNIVIDKLNVIGKEVTDPTEISCVLNDYFCNIGPSLVKNLPVVESNYADYMGRSVSDSMFFEPITTDELCNVIRSLDVNKSSGADGIGSRLLKDNMYLLCEPLVYIYNLSIMNGVVPDALKIAKIIPIFKKGDVHLACNYRPISLLSIFNKILEKLIHRRLSNFLLKNNILYKHQFGFRKNHSTSLALLEIVDTCYKHLDQNDKVIGIYFDLQKAFDTVDHCILLQKLYNCGIRGVMYNWIQNYLSNRSQFTFVNNVSSDIGNIVCGVPQGSVLGPLLFLLYVNDISNAVSGDRLKMFADDTNLFIFGSNISVIETEANICLKNMELWFIANKLSLNIDKTCYTLFNKFGKNVHNTSLDLHINGQQITKVASSKYLGVIIDESFKWNEHVTYVYKKLVRFIGIFYKLRNVLPTACLNKLYYAFIHPHILYGIEVYGNTSKVGLDKLCKLNNKLLRILLHKQFVTPTMDLYVAMNTLPIPTLHELQLLIFIHKYAFHNFLLPEIFHNYLLKNDSVHGYNTRGKSGFHISVVNSNFGLRCTAYRGSRFWNNLPDNLKTISSQLSFKKAVKQYLLHRCRL